MKKMLFGFLALAIVTAAFAFRDQPAHNTDDVPVWFILKPGGNPDNPADYVLATGGQENGCEGDETVCAIKAVPDANNSHLPRMNASFTYDQQLINEIDKSQAGLNPSATYVRERE